jgi:hypothetical protein
LDVLAEPQAARTATPAAEAVVARICRRERERDMKTPIANRVMSMR